MATRVLITGDRHWNCLRLAERIVERLLVRYEDLVIVHGAAKGVDEVFALACDALDVDHEPYPADWTKHGKAAGPIRNREMVASGITFVVAVHRRLVGSRGTRDCVRQALAAGIPVYLLDSEDAEPRRIRELP